MIRGYILIISSGEMHLDQQHFVKKTKWWYRFLIRYFSTTTLRTCITSHVKQHSDAPEKCKGARQMCTGRKKICNCVRPSRNTLFPGLTHWNMGELLSRCWSMLSVPGRTWLSQSEYQCVLRQTGSVYISPFLHVGGATHNFWAPFEFSTILGRSLCEPSKLGIEHLQSVYAMSQASAELHVQIWK